MKFDKEHLPGKPKDHRAFWNQSIQESKRQPLNPKLETQAYPIPEIEVFKASFEGFGKGRQVGWYILPKKRAAKIPFVLAFQGYTWFKGIPTYHAHWLLQGFGVLSMDTRGQGAADGTDGMAYPGGHILGYMTKGILDPETYYYRHVFMDTLRALDFLHTRPEVDCSRIMVQGESQGGGMTLALASLDARVALAAPDVAFMIQVPQLLYNGGANWTFEIREFIKRFPNQESRILETLSYFDLIHHVPQIRCPILLSSGADDPTCPASAIQAAFKAVKGRDKELCNYPFNTHELHIGHTDKKMAWVRRHFFPSEKAS